MKDAFIIATKAYGLALAANVVHEAGHALIGYLQGDRDGKIYLGTNARSLHAQPMLDLGRVKIIDPNPFSGAYHCACSHKSVLQRTTQSAAGPLASMAFTYLINKHLEPNSFLAYWNKASQVGQATNFFPANYTPENDGRQICDATGLNKNLARSIVGPLILYNVYQLGRNVYRHESKSTQLIMTLSFLYFIKISYAMI